MNFKEIPCVTCASTGRCLMCGGVGVMRDGPMCERCKRIPTQEGHEEACAAYDAACNAYREHGDDLLKAARALYPAFANSSRFVTAVDRAESRP